MKNKAIIAVGVIFLFLGLAISPVTAKTDEKVTYSLVGEDGLQEFTFSEKEDAMVQEFLSNLVERMSTATSESELMEIVDGFMDNCFGRPFLSLLLQLIIKFIDFNHKINQLRPLRKKAFIMSWGFTNKINPFKDNKMQLYRPITLWYYSGKSGFLANSRTFILGSPFSIKMLTGRQVGLMTNFAGLYIHRETTFTKQSYTLFMGYANAVRGFDLSLMNIWGQ